MSSEKPSFSQETVREAVRIIDESWLIAETWNLDKVSIQGDEIIGAYHIALKDSFDSKAPHKPLLHGSTMFTICVYHSLIAHMIIILGKTYPELRKIPDVPISEIRRRILLPETNLKFLKPIFSEHITVKARFTKFVDKWDSHSLFFTQLEFDVQDGAQIATLDVCLDFRDDLI